MIRSTAQVPTRNGGKFLQQLCKHWSHSLSVEFTPERGTVIFPANIRGEQFPSEGRVEMIAHPDSLEVQVEGADERQVARLRDVVASHLDRFAFREAPLRFDWDG